MKACKFCGTVVENTKRKCPECGSTELLHVCENCGEHFDGNFCPKCGVKVGQKGKTCPECQTVYFSNACPNCGYTPTRKAPAEQKVIHEHVYVNTPPAQSAPATRSFSQRTVKKKKKKHWLLWIIAIIIVVALFGGNSKKDKSTEKATKTSAPVVTTAPTKKTQSEAKTEANNVTTAPAKDTEVPVTEVPATEAPKESELDIILRDGHPTYYGSVEQSHKTWSDIKGKRIEFADDFYASNNKAILTMSNSHNGSGIINTIIISFDNFEENPHLSLQDALPIAASYMPFEIMDQYYEFSKSFMVKDSANAEYYCVSYRLTDAAGDAYYKHEHSYSGTIDVIFCVKNNVVSYIDIGFGTPRWFTGENYNAWECDLYNYRGQMTTGAKEEQVAELTKTYADDPVVNRFINEYNALYPDDQIIEAERGNIRTKYFVTIGGQYTELLNANDNAAESFVVKINAGNTDADKEPLLKAFAKVAVILEPDMDDATLQAGIKELTGDNTMKTITMGKTLEVTYVPSVKLSYGRNNYRIDIDAKNYK